MQSYQKPNFRKAPDNKPLTVEFLSLSKGFAISSPVTKHPFVSVLFAAALGLPIFPLCAAPESAVLPDKPGEAGRSTGDLSESQPAKEFSVAGFYPLKDGGDREVFNFNPGWRFIKSDVADAWKVDFDDSGWETVNLPHTLELLPENANGSYYYRGPSWYRKHFKLDRVLEGRKLFVYFEGVMQKCTVWVNGKECLKHEGGYLPFAIDITAYAKSDTENVVAVMADNSDDRTFPPGKEEKGLDFSYFGGIYRDVYMISTNPLHVSDPILLNRTADGGLFVHSENVSEEKADLVVRTNIQNEGSMERKVSLETVLKSLDGKIIAEMKNEISLASGSDKTTEQRLNVSNPALWTPNTPNLYYVDTCIKADGKIIDGMRTRIGIRSIEFRGKKLFVNGKESEFLTGANKHQDMAYVGNAVPNSRQYHDASLMREAGFRVYRSHYPQDPAFMDGCDEFGIFAIISTPGWWFFTPDYGFPEKWMQNVSEMIRINRNRPSCLLWEIALNESFCPNEWIKKAHHIAHAEYPYPGCFTVEDTPITYHGGYFKDGKYQPQPKEEREYPTDVSYQIRDKDWMGRLWENDRNRPQFDRECTAYLDTGRNHVGGVSRNDGEIPMFDQAKFYTSWLNHSSKQDRAFGRALWCAIDCYHGYANSGYTNGPLDYYRLPKSSFQVFKSQNDAELKIPGVKTGPMVSIAHSMTAFSPEDIVVYTNCEEVRLTIPPDIGPLRTMEGKPARDLYKNMPHPPVIFKNVFNWNKDKEKWAPPTPSTVCSETGTLIAEGLINGKVVATDVKKTPKFATELEVEIDDGGSPLVADAGDFVPVRFYFVDKNGARKVMARNLVYFTVEGEGTIIGDESNQANPFLSEFGSAVVFIRSTIKPGLIKVTATTRNMGKATITLKSVPPPVPLLIGRDTGNVAAKGRSKNSDLIKGDKGVGVRDEDYEKQLLIAPKEEINY